METPAPAAAGRGDGPPTAARRIKGRYRIVHEQATGAFGTVCLADDEVTGEPVILRLLPREWTERPDVVAAIQRRARQNMAASRIHPSMVRVLEYGTTEDGRLLIVVERAEGRRLSDLLTPDYRPDFTETLRLALELGGPIETLHNFGVAHGALRPRNFMLLDDGRVKLMDIELLGLRSDGPMQELALADAPAEYLAPEQVEGRSINEKTDVYAFATIVYQMLCGAPPFEGSTRQEVLDKHLHEAPPSLRRQRRSVSAGADAMIMAALDKRPERRPFMPEILNCFTGQAGVSGPRRKWSVVVAGIVVAILAIGAPLAWTLWPSRQPVVPSPPPVAVEPAPRSGEPPNALPASSVTAPPAATVPTTPAGAEPLAGRGVSTPPSAIAPPKPAAASTRPSGERPQPSAPPSVASRTTAPPATSNESEYDPAAVIDWLLNRR